VTRKVLPNDRLSDFIDDDRWREAPRETFSDDRAWRRWNAAHAGRKIGDTTALKVKRIKRGDK
jgi:hypothetical protein